MAISRTTQQRMVWLLTRFPPLPRALTEQCGLVRRMASAQCRKVPGEPTRSVMDCPLTISTAFCKIPAKSCGSELLAVSRPLVQDISMCPEGCLSRCTSQYSGLQRTETDGSGLQPPVTCCT